MLRVGVLVSLLVAAPWLAAQSAWAPKGDPLGEVQSMIGAGRLRDATRLLDALPRAETPTEQARRDLLRAATLEGRARAEALLAIAERSPNDPVAFHALLALWQHLLADDESCRHPDFQPVFGPYRKTAMDYGAELRIPSSELFAFARRAQRLAPAAEVARPKIPAASGTVMLDALFELMVRSKHPPIRIADVDALPVPTTLDGPLLVRLRGDARGPILFETTLGPETERLAIPADIPRRFLLELVDGDGVVARTVIRSRVTATAHAFDDAVVVGVVRDGAPVAGAEVVHANRRLVTDTHGLAMFSPRGYAGGFTSIPVTVDDDFQLLPVDRRGPDSVLEPRTAAHAVLERESPAPGERLRGRITVFHADDQLSPLSPFASDRIRADLRHGDTTVDLGSIATDAAGGFNLDYEIPADAAENRLSLGIHTGKGAPIRLGIARITPANAVPEVSIVADRTDRRRLAIGASHAGRLTVTCTAAGLVSVVAADVDAARPFMLAIDDAPDATESVRIEATLTTAGGKAFASLDHDPRTPTPTDEGPARFTLVRSAPSFPAIDDAASTGPARTGLEIRGRPGIPYLVSAVQRLDVRPTLIVADAEGRAPLPDFGAAAGSVRHLLIAAVVPGADAEHHVIEAADASIRVSRVPTPQGTFALVPALQGPDAGDVDAVFTALVVEGHHDLSPFPFTASLDGDPPACTLSTTPEAGRPSDVLGDMIHRGRPRHHALATRLGDAPNSPFASRRPVVLDRATPSDPTPPGKPLAFVPAWKTSEGRPCVALPPSVPCTVFLWGVGVDGRTAFTKVKVGTAPSVSSTPSGLGRAYADRVRDVTARLRTDDLRVVASTLATLPAVLPASVVPDLREALGRLLGAPPSDPPWAFPAEVGPALTEALLDPGILAAARARGFDDAMPAFPDPRHPATESARLRLRDAPDEDPDLRARLLVNRWAVDPFGTAAELATTIRGSAPIRKGVLARFEEAARSQRLDAERPTDGRSPIAPSAALGAHVALLDAVDSRLAAGDGAWCVTASHLLIRNPPAETPRAVRSALDTVQGRLADRVVGLLGSLPYSHPSVVWWLAHLDLSAVVAALPPDTQTERVVGLLDAWFGDAGEAVASPRDVVTTLLDAARDVRTVDLRSLTTAPPSTPPWSKRAIAAFAHLASRTRSDAVRAALLPYVTPAVARAMSDDALRAWPWPSAPAVRIELMRRDDAWTSYPGMPAGANADADLPLYLRLAHGADPAEAWGALDLPALLAVGASDGWSDFDALLQALTDNALDAPLPDARVSDVPLVEALFRCRERRGLRLTIARALGRRGLWDFPWPPGTEEAFEDARVVIACEARRPDARERLDAFIARHPERAREAAAWWPASAPESRTASRTATNDSAIEGWMWTTLGARQGASFARLRDLLRRTSPSAILDGDQADAELIDAWLLHVGLGLPNP